MPGDSRRPSNLPFHLLLGSVMLGLGALEGWFGRPELFGDDISYLDVANMIHLGDWKGAFNPLWSLGYPALLAGVKPFFAAGLRGEMNAVFALNLTIYIAGWFSLLGLLRTAAEFIEPARAGKPLARLTLLAAGCVYVCVQIGLGRVSSVGPDELVSCLFFVASALLLRFQLRPTVRRGVLLGMALGAGFIVKAVFLPLSVILLVCALAPRRNMRPAVALSAPAALLLLMLPYAAGISWAIGRPTLGESGALNYAFHVNQLPHWMGWQGGPPRLGYPDHPVHLLRTHPAVFAFGEPFHVTYPPQFNLHYWYDGYRHFFSLPNAVRAILTNLHALEAVLHENWPITLAVLLAFALLAWNVRVHHPSRSVRWVGSKLWPLYLPSILGLLLYLQVHLEGRYIAAFVAILALLPFLDVENVSPRMQAVLATLIVAGASLDLGIQLRAPIRLALSHADMQSGGQWKIAASLREAGLRPGDAVASVSTLNDIRCTWAYAARLRIVADIGNDAFDPADQQQDFNLFWSDPATQQDVLRLFHEQGARAVIAPSVSSEMPPLSAAWRHIPDTNAWLLRLD